MDLKLSSYCRLEFFCFLGVDKVETSKKEKCFRVQDLSEFINNEDYDVYVEDYHNISSVISRISEIGKEFDTKYHSDYQEYWSDMRVNNGNEQEIGAAPVMLYDQWGNDLIVNEQEIGAASVMLYNQWGNNLIVAVLFDKWMIPGHTYESYENYRYRISNEKSIILQLPDYSMFSEKQFMSNKIAVLMIKEWLDTNNINTDLYYQ
jgi:hypothetical protein